MKNTNTNIAVAILCEQNLIHRVFFLTGLPSKLSIDQDAAFTSKIIKEVFKSLECTMQIISPWNHGSSKAERQIQTTGNMINKHLSQKGASWLLYAAVSAYAMNTFMSMALQGLSSFELVFSRKPRQLTGFQIPPIKHCEHCGMGFPFMSRLEQHKVTHWKLATLPCMHKNCGRTFKNLGDLNRHVSQHNGIWYTCDFCTYRNKDKRNTN